MITRTSFINLALVYLLLFLSGSWRYNLAPNNHLVVGFVIALVAWYLYSDRRISGKFVLYAIAFFSFYFALMLYTGGGITLGSSISALMKLTVAYLILKTVGDQFSDTYVKVVVFLAAISLFGYMTDTFNLFNGLVRRMPPVGDMGYEGILYLYRFPWHMERNNSIFFEPGAYQIFLNAALFLIFFTKTNFKPSTKLVYIAVLATTLVTTFSTTGFLIFLAMFPLILYRSDTLTFNQKISIVGAFVLVVGLFATQFHQTFVVKLNNYLSAGEYDQVAMSAARSSDRQTDLKIFRKHIFGVGYEKYSEEFLFLSRRREDQIGSSNGITKTLAVMGLPFSLFLFGSYYWAFKRLLGDYQLSTVAFVMLLMFLVGESYYVVTPVTCAVIAAAFAFNRPPIQKEVPDRGDHQTRGQSRSHPSS